jgi:hypothetical protein
MGTFAENNLQRIVVHTGIETEMVVLGFELNYFTSSLYADEILYQLEEGDAFIISLGNNRPADVEIVISVDGRPVLGEKDAIDLDKDRGYILRTGDYISFAGWSINHKKVASLDGGQSSKNESSATARKMNGPEDEPGVIKIRVYRGRVFETLDSGEVDKFNSDDFVREGVECQTPDDPGKLIIFSRAIFIREDSAGSELTIRYNSKEGWERNGVTVPRWARQPLANIKPA